VRDHTVHVDGVGDVCSLAAFDFDRHGNPKYAAPSAAPDKRARSKQGKMEKSFLTFVATYPTWAPPPAGRQMLAALSRHADAAAWGGRGGGGGWGGASAWGAPPGAPPARPHPQQQHAQHAANHQAQHAAAATAAAHANGGWDCGAAAAPPPPLGGASPAAHPLANGFCTPKGLSPRLGPLADGPPAPGARGSLDADASDWLLPPAGLADAAPAGDQLRANGHHHYHHPAPHSQQQQQHAYPHAANHPQQQHPQQPAAQQHPQHHPQQPPPPPPMQVRLPAPPPPLAYAPHPGAAPHAVLSVWPSTLYPGGPNAAAALPPTMGGWGPGSGGWGAGARSDATGGGGGDGAWSVFGAGPWGGAGGDASAAAGAGSCLLGAPPGAGSDLLPVNEAVDLGGRLAASHLLLQSFYQGQDDTVQHRLANRAHARSALLQRALDGGALSVAPFLAASAGAAGGGGPASGAVRSGGSLHSHHHHHHPAPSPRSPLTRTALY
jgi:hypothetical protein